MHILRYSFIITCLAFPALFVVPIQLAQAKLPPIRLSSTNQVPACVTPERLMAFLQTRNKRLIPRFRKIAEWYKYHGEAWKVRWDYAFYQMAIETNFLTYRTPSGRWGDVRPKQNNFAGIGTTGGGVPGNSFPDVNTGVLAQIQHLMVYSGERLDNPVAPRTRLKQHIILKLSRPVARRRAVTFQDLSGRWAVDRRYGRSIEYVARLYRKRFCSGPQQHNLAQTTKQHKTRLAASYSQGNLDFGRTSFAAKANLTALPHSARECRVQTASYGGSKTLLIQSVAQNTVQFIALDVHPGFEEQQARKFAATHAPDGQTIASFDNRDAALGTAHALCKRLTAKG